MKAWNYYEVTKAAAEQIARLMLDSRNTEPDTAFTYRQWAYGVYLAWNALTTGWQNTGDREAMEALTRKSDE